jgi:hypothetical protein
MSGPDNQLIERLRERQKIVHRPLTAFFLYLEDIRKDLFASNPNSSVPEIGRLAGYCIFWYP